MKLFITYMFLCVILFCSFVYMHEEVHVQIYAKYGVESHIELFSNFPDATTIAEGPCPVEECNLAHNINEAISYVLMPFFIMVMFGLGIIIGLIEVKG